MGCPHSGHPTNKELIYEHFFTTVFHDGQFPNMGLNSQESIQILIPTILVGLFLETGVKSGVNSDMLIVHISLLYIKYLHNNFLYKFSITSQHKIWGQIPTRTLGK